MTAALLRADAPDGCHGEILHGAVAAVGGERAWRSLRSPARSEELAAELVRARA